MTTPTFSGFLSNFASTTGTSGTYTDILSTFGQAATSQTQPDGTGVVPNQSEKDKYVGWINSGAYTSDTLAVYASELTLNPVVIKLIGMDLTGISFEMIN